MSNFKSLSRNCVITILLIFLSVLPLFGQNDFPYQPVSLFRWCPFEREKSAPNRHIFGVGDQNDDGYNDFIFEFGGYGQESVRLYLGGSDIDTLHDLEFTPASSLAGDINGDGYVDILARLYDYEHGWTLEDYGICFGGEMDSTVDVYLPIPEGVADYEYSSIGDVNLDGFDDLLLETSHSNMDIPARIKDFTVLFGGGEYDSFSTWHVTEDSTNRFRPSIKRVGFGNFDGNDAVDVLIINVANSYEFINQVYVIHDFLMVDHPDTTYFMEHLPQNNQVWKGWVIKDITGDGLDEFLVFTETQYLDDMHNLLFYGDREKDNEPDFELINEYGGFVIDANNIGDINGDGYDDLGIAFSMMAQWGEFYLGGPEIQQERAAQITGTFEGVEYGRGSIAYKIRWCGDVNGNGIDDFLVINDAPFPTKAAFVMSLDAEFADVDHGKRGDNLVPDEFLLQSPYPNPFNSSVKINFDFDHPSYANLSIYNTNGQLVNELAERWFKQGSHHFIWKGVSEAGAPIASGNYFLRLVTETEQSERVLMLVR